MGVKGVARGQYRWQGRRMERGARPKNKLDLSGSEVGYAKVLSRATEWIGQHDTLYDVFKTCCGKRELIVHRILVRLKSQEKMAAETGNPDLVTRCCFSCASKKKADITNSRFADLGPAMPMKNRQGPSERLLRIREMNAAATRRAHDFAMGRLANV